MRLQHGFSWRRSLKVWRVICICGDYYPCPDWYREERERLEHEELVSHGYGRGRL